MTPALIASAKVSKNTGLVIQFQLSAVPCMLQGAFDTPPQSTMLSKREVV